MKFKTSIFIILSLIIFSHVIETSSNIKTHTARYKVSRIHSKKNKLSDNDKLKEFLVGFIQGVLTNLIKNNVIPKLQTDPNYIDINQVSGTILTVCLPQLISDYNSAIHKVKQLQGLDSSVINKVFKSEEIDEILKICKKKESIDKLDDNDYSTIEVIKGWTANIFTDSVFYKNYQQFKVEKNNLEDNLKVLNKKYEKLLEQRKETITDNKAKEFAKEAYEALNSIIFGKKDICEIISEFNNIGFYDHLTCLFKASINNLLCSAEQFSPIIKDKIKQITNNILTNLGVGVLKGAIIGVFPPALIYFITNFIWNNFSTIIKLAKISFSPNNNSEKELYNTVGVLIGNNIIRLITRRKNIKKKLFK